jgi:hypothetical protein
MPVEEWVRLSPNSTRSRIEGLLAAWDDSEEAQRLWAKMGTVLALDAILGFQRGGADALTELGYTAQDVKKAGPKGEGFPPERFVLRDPAIRRMLSLTVGSSIKGIREQTRRSIANSILRGLSGNFGPERMTGQIDKIVQNRDRAELIARTELKRTRQIGRLMTFQQNGVEYVEWICQFGACSRCRDNEAAGAVPLRSGLLAPSPPSAHFGGMFPSGHDHPPLHPRCRCRVSPFSRRCWVGVGKLLRKAAADPCAWDRPEVPWSGQRRSA